MYYKKLKVLILVTMLIFLVASLFIDDCYAKDTKKILIIHSYNLKYEWVKEYVSGLKDGFKKYGLYNYNLIVKEFYMNAKRQPELLKGKSVQAYSLYKNFNPDIIIAADDAAQEFFVVPYISGKTKTPVVFLGVNADPSVYGYPSNNVTGVLERMNYFENITLLHMLIPDAKTYGVIIDNNITSKRFLERWVKSEKNFNLRFKVIYIANNFEEWKKYVIRLQKEVDVIYLLSYFTLKDKYGNYVDPGNVIKWYLKNCKKPETSPLIFSVKEGILCAYGESGYIQGIDASKLVSDILVKGISVRKIPIVNHKRGLRAINKRRAKELGIEIPAELIPGTVFYE